MSEPKRSPKPWHLLCGSCNKEHAIAQYAIAQTAMGHTMVLTCNGCGSQMKVTPAFVSRCKP